MHKLHMYHGVALLSGRAYHSLQVGLLLLPVYKPALSARLIGSESVCVCVHTCDVENKGA